MEDLNIKKLSEIDEEFTEQAVKVFIDGFYEPLSNLSKDKTKLLKAFKSSFVKEQIYVGLLNNQVVGMIGYATHEKPAKVADKQTLQRELGYFRGWIASSVLSEQPIPIGTNQAYLEDIATASEARGKGIATKLIHHVMNTLPYEEYTLEVVDTNVGAVRLYEKLGFVIFQRKPQRFFKKQVGFNERLYMIKKR